MEKAFGDHPGFSQGAVPGIKVGDIGGNKPGPNTARNPLEQFNPMPSARGPISEIKEDENEDKSRMPSLPSISRGSKREI